eukprot:7216375-Pyramimonas_sp.AAC.1
MIRLGPGDCLSSKLSCPNFAAVSTSLLTASSRNITRALVVSALAPCCSNDFSASNILRRTAICYMMS